jgi:peptide/nickel transport system permease protein
MAKFILRRSLQTVIVLVLVSLFAFSILHMLPGDPALIILGEDASQAQIDALRLELGLDQPVLVQYARWFTNMLQGDFGRSILYHENVADLIATRLPITLHLGLVAFVLSALIGIPAGILSAVRRGDLMDSLITVSANLGIAVPVFWLGILGIYFFSLKLAWLPVQGYTSPFDDFWLSTKQLIMPAACLTVVPVAVLARQTRSSMLEALHQDYVRTARSKGLRESAVIMGHGLKNAIIPVVTLLGLQARYLVGGSILVETVFNIPGMGRLMVSGVFNQDFVIVQAGIVVIGIVVGMANLAVDISYGYLDPRIRYDNH